MREEWPYTFPVMSHIVVTAAFALLVFFRVLIYGFYNRRLPAMGPTLHGPLVNVFHATVNAARREAPQVAGSQ